MSQIEVERDGSVARVWLNRPEVRNAFDGETVTELRGAFDDLARDDSVRVVVLGGRGKAFSAGADLEELPHTGARDGLLVLALARPQLIEPPISRVLPTRDLMLLVDLSGSMETEDFTNASGETVDRLSAVKEVLDEFLTRREGDRVGLIVFGNAAFTQVDVALFSAGAGPAFLARTAAVSKREDVVLGPGHLDDLSRSHDVSKSCLYRRQPDSGGNPHPPGNGKKSSA